MPKILIEAHLVPHNGKMRWRVCVPKALRGSDRRSRRFFPTEVKAKSFARELNESRNGLTRHFLALPPDTQSRLLLCLERVKGSVAVLEAAAQAAADAEVKTRVLLPAAILECVTAKEKADRRDIYTVNLEITLSQFAAGREGRAVSEITTEELDRWLNGNGWAAETRRAYLSRLRTFFGWCRKRGYAATNPALLLERPSADQQPPGILTVDECKRLLATCREKDPKLLPYVSLALFAGIRPFEARRLSWANIQGGWINVPGHKAKTRARRLVEIWPPLDAWLALKGELPPGPNFPKRWAAVRIAAKVTWSHDCMRHSFCSYALPVHGAAKTALMAGHSEAMLFRHYRELVPESAANEFWSIRP